MSADVPSQFSSPSFAASVDRLAAAQLQWEVYQMQLHQMQSPYSMYMCIIDSLPYCFPFRQCLLVTKFQSNLALLRNACHVSSWYCCWDGFATISFVSLFYLFIYSFIYLFLPAFPNSVLFTGIFLRFGRIISKVDGLGYTDNAWQQQRHAAPFIDCIAHHQPQVVSHWRQGSQEGAISLPALRVPRYTESDEEQRRISASNAAAA